MASYEPGIDADALLAFCCAVLEVPRADAYPLVAEMVVRCDSTRSAIRALVGELDPSRLPDLDHLTTGWFKEYTN